MLHTKEIQAASVLADLSQQTVATEFGTRIERERVAFLNRQMVIKLQIFFVSLCPLNCDTCMHIDKYYITVNEHCTCHIAR